MKAEPGPLRRPASAGAVFLAFNRMALQGFGGVLPVAQHVLVERERWLDEASFLETLALAQVLPGGNVVNMALMVGDRFFGWRGALAALAGLLALPLVIVLALAALHGPFAELGPVTGALRGMGAVAAGLVIASAIKLLPGLRANVLGPTLALALVALAFAAIALLRWPLLGVLGGLGAAACGLAWHRGRR